MHIHICDTHGNIGIGSYSICWGNALYDVDLPGFFCLNLGNFSLEFGDVDQGKPGIYTTVYTDGEITERHTIWQAK